MLKKPRKRRQDDALNASRLANEALYHALMAGAITFLNLKEKVMVLNTCSLLRGDGNLAMAALRSSSIGPHLLQKCAHDWTHLIPENSQQLIEKYDGRCTIHTENDINRFLVEDSHVNTARGRLVQLLSLIGMVERHILPLCYMYSPANSFGDMCVARPLILPLTDMLATDKKWTMDDVKYALNSISDRFGDDFTGSRSEYMHVSNAGAHWENILVSMRGKKDSCNFCDAAKTAIREYRKEVKVLLKRFEDVLAMKKQTWRAQGVDADEIHRRKSELKIKFFPDDSYPDVNFADSLDDEVLADICESDRFPMDPFEGTAAGFEAERRNDDIYNALAEEQMEICCSLYRPLKRVLSKQLSCLGQRVFRHWMNDANGDINSELIAGVSSSGFVCGVFIVVRRAEYEGPHNLMYESANYLVDE